MIGSTANKRRHTGEEYNPEEIHEIFDGTFDCWWHHFSYDIDDPDAPWGPEPRPFSSVFGTRPYRPNGPDTQPKLYPDGREFHFINFEGVPHPKQSNTLAHQHAYNDYGMRYAWHIRETFPNVRIGATIPYWDRDLATERTQGTISYEDDALDNSWQLNAMKTWTAGQGYRNPYPSFFSVVDVLMPQLHGYADLYFEDWVPPLFDWLSSMCVDIMPVIGPRQKDRNHPDKPYVYTNHDEFEYLCETLACEYGVRDALFWHSEEDFDGQAWYRNCMGRYFQEQANARSSQPDRDRPRSRPDRQVQRKNRRPRGRRPRR